jgi:hypothetical protein
MDEKSPKPPYTSYKGFINFLDELREHGEAPSVIDRSLLSKRSGSGQSALMAALRWFSLINDVGVPTTAFVDLFKATEPDRPTQIKKLIEGSYTFLSDGSINVRNATTAQLSERFRLYDISGSTLAKSIAFFMAACKEAGIALSPHIKVPSVANGGSRQPKRKTGRIPDAWIPPSQPAQATEASQQKRALDESDTIEIPIPIFGMRDGAIVLPAKLNDKQWAAVVKMTQFILTNYRETHASSNGAGADKTDAE